MLIKSLNSIENYKEVLPFYRIVFILFKFYYFDLFYNYFSYIYIYLCISYIYIYMYFLYIYIYIWSYRWLWATMWLLGIEPGSFARATDALNHALNHWAALQPFKKNLFLGRASSVAQAGLRLAAVFHITLLRAGFWGEPPHLVVVIPNMHNVYIKNNLCAM